MNDRFPIVKQFLACESISTSDETGALLIRRPFHTIHLPAGARIPYRVLEIWFYSQLTNAVQLNQVSVRMVEADSGRMIGTSRLLTIPLVQSKADGIEAFFLLLAVPFDRLGLNHYMLVSNGQELAGSRRELTIC